MSVARAIASRLPRPMRRMASRIKRHFSGRAVILMYHRIADLPADPQLLAVTGQHFAEHLDVIQSSYRPMRLEGLAAALRDGRVPDGAVVVTMDDGYADNLHSARPLLESYGVPATIFVTSGYVRSGRPFWWDELERIILRPGTLLPRLRFEAKGQSREYDVEMVRYSDRDWEHHRAWHVELAGNPTARHRLYRTLYDDLYRLTAQDRATAIGALRHSVTSQADCSVGRPLTADELLQLARSPLVDIGAHGVTHASLPQLLPPEQRYEIQESRLQLEGILDRPVTTFGYPHGGVTPEIVELVQQAAFGCAGASEAEAVTRRSHPYRLPRMLVRDWSGDEFARRLHGWFSA